MKRSTTSAKAVSPAIQRLKTAAEAQSGSRPLTARGVAELCGVELKTVHNWATEGLIPHFRTPGRHLRFDALAVVAFLETLGYEVPKGRERGPVLCLARGTARTKLRKLFAEDSVEWADDIVGLLLRAGRRPPSLVLIAAEQLAGLSATDVFRGLAQHLPKTRLALLGGTGRVPRGVIRVVDPSAAALEAALGS